jgi:hypothetical protein
MGYPALEWLFEAVEEQWSIEKTPEPEILSLKLISMEWLTVQALQHILKRFAIANKQLQSNPASNNGRPTTGRFCKYIPVIELLLDYLECAITGTLVTVIVTYESGQRKITCIKLFTGA